MKDIGGVEMPEYLARLTPMADNGAVVRSRSGTGGAAATDSVAMPSAGDESPPKVPQPEPAQAVAGNPE